jgi:hypothetical protein
MLNLIPVLLAKAGAATLTTKVVVAGAVSAATLGTAGATGVIPVEELLPGDRATSATVLDERPGQDALDGAFDRAGEVAAEEAQKALEDAQKAADDAREDAQKAVEDAQKAADGARQADGEKPAQAQQHEPVEAAPEQAEQRDAPSSGGVATDQPESGAGDSGARGRN